MLKGKNILIVDDDAYNIFALSAALEDFEANITSVTNGVDAVAAVTATDQPMDIVLMDIMMPEMDGYEAMRTIRDKGFTDLPIVALTAKAMRGDIEKCLEAGASDYMAKPIDVAKLIELMEKLLQKK
ncbi:MAG: response regulator [Filimonas sp.]|nr:response regulator [Filimonas sp.]